MDTSTLGDRIRALRVSKGLTHAALGAKIGVAASTVQGWESGRRPVRPVYFEALARVLEVPTSTLDPDLAKDSPPPPITPARLRDGLLETIEGAIEARVVTVDEIAARLRSIRLQSASSSASGPADLITQAEAARTLGVTRQAVYQWVASGQVQSYPNPDRPDRAPMVSLAEVQAFAAKRTGPSGPSVVQPVNEHPVPDETISEVASVRGEGSEKQQGTEGIPDPPWMTREMIAEQLRESSAAGNGTDFLDLSPEEQEASITHFLEASRISWRKKSSERRAELLARYHQRQARRRRE